MRRALSWIGFVVWSVATIGLAVLAGPLFGSGKSAYWLSTIGLCIGFDLLFVGAAALVRLPRREWGQAAALFAAPGLLGEVPVMLNIADALPSLPIGAAPGYAAFLFLGYGLLLGTAAIVSAGDATLRHEASKPGP